MRAMLVVLLAAFMGSTVAAVGEVPTYLWAEISVPDGALDGLADRAQSMGIPTAVWLPEEPTLHGAETLADLEAAGIYLIIDGPFFLFSWEGNPSNAVFRGREGAGELILGASGSVPNVVAFLEILDLLGLMPDACELDLAERQVPEKLPPAPEDVRLDSVLWALVEHPDWFGFADRKDLERVGLRVRVVAETTGELDEAFEPYIESAANGLTELLLPIPLLPELGRDPNVTLVREPHRPHPAPVGGEGE